MFDIGFAELLILAVLTLLVVGPERLPATVKSIARTLTKFKHNWNSVRREIEKEIGMDEIRRDLHNEQVMRDLEKMNQRVSLDSIVGDREEPSDKEKRSISASESEAIEDLGQQESTPENSGSKPPDSTESNNILDSSDRNPSEK